MPIASFLYPMEQKVPEVRIFVHRVNVDMKCAQCQKHLEDHAFIFFWGMLVFEELVQVAIR